MKKPILPGGALVSRAEKEEHFQQRACVIWFYGRPAAGKTTLASKLERRLAATGCATALLDGDDLRRGLNRDLGFSDTDRAENIRRAAEAAKLFAQSGVVTLCAFITPLATHREIVRRIINADDLIEIYVSASMAVCAKRDWKGLYARAAEGRLAQFTGRDSAFDAPISSESPIVIDTENEAIVDGVERLYSRVLARVRPVQRTMS